MSLKRFTLFKEDILLTQNHRDAKFEFNSDSIFHAKCTNLDKHKAFTQVTANLIQKPMLTYYKEGTF